MERTFEMDENQPIRKKDLPKLVAKYYGLRDKDGNTNGKLNWRFVFSDIAKAVIIAMLLGGGRGLWGMYREHLQMKSDVHELQNCQSDFKEYISQDRLFKEKLGNDLSEIKGELRYIRRGR